MVGAIPVSLPSSVAALDAEHTGWLSGTGEHYGLGEQVAGE
jgi:hypothetical protein